MFSQGLIDRLEGARRVVVLTGAGVSAESGVPTFRGKGGLWKRYKPEELANPSAFIRNPELVWEWYSYRRKLIVGIKPNSGHYALAELEGMFPHFALITQNIDGLHKAAGSRVILELHGNIMRNRCFECNRTFRSIDPGDEPRVPRCSCGGFIRPDVVWFGESLPADQLSRAMEAAEGAEVFLSVGTSAQVQPTASLPLVAKRNGAHVVEINPERTPISHLVDEFIQGESGEVLPQLVQAIKA